MSWASYFDGFGDAFGYGAQQQHADWFNRGGSQNQTVAAYNQQYCVSSSNLQNIQDLLSARPGGIVRVSSPDAVQALSRPKPAVDCKGCGAPLKAYIHQCEYCRRATC